VIDKPNLRLSNPGLPLRKETASKLHGTTRVDAENEKCRKRNRRISQDPRNQLRFEGCVPLACSASVALSLIFWASSRLAHWREDQYRGRRKGQLFEFCEDVRRHSTTPRWQEIRRIPDCRLLLRSLRLSRQALHRNRGVFNRQ